MRIVSDEKIVLIRSSGINLEEFSLGTIDPVRVAALRRDLGADGSTLIVLMVARTLRSKGIEEFVEVSSRLTREHPKTKFVLVGGGDEGNPLNIPASVLTAKQSESFVWLGWRSDVRELLAAADLVMLLSRDREGVPRVLLEAMSMRKPIIATDVPGCRETVDDGKNGYLVPPRDVDGTLAALKKLLSSPAVRLAFGDASLQKVRREFDQVEVNDRIFRELYQYCEP